MDAIGKKTKKRRALFQKLRESWKWKFMRDFKWKRLNLHISFFDAIIFRFISLFEAITLVKLAELLEQEGADIIQTEGGKGSHPSKSGVLGLIEKAAPTLASAYSISRAVKIPVMCSSGLSAVTAPMAITAGAAGVGVGSAVNKLNDIVAMIAEVRSIADSLVPSSGNLSRLEEAFLKQ